MGWYTQVACVTAMLAAVAACGTPPLPAAAPPPAATTTVTAPPVTTSPAPSTTTRGRPAPPSSRRARPPASEAAEGCGRRAVTAEKFNPACREYQGYLDPGTSAGRAPTSGETQRQYGCAQGWIPKSEC